MVKFSFWQNFIKELQKQYKYIWMAWWWEEGKMINNTLNKIISKLLV